MPGASWDVEIGKAPRRRRWRKWNREESMYVAAFHRASPVRAFETSAACGAPGHRMSCKLHELRGYALLRKLLHDRF